ncbi:efflux RND transporter periplasmic adaptor subunit [Antarctobacter jejuensis]|uniref:efflux RND transporter periplasmic adaptor subunit n=1 Tax=Antarctobacter jejuensis TaxID=1439938 RepID=UPI003FD51065
MRFLPRFLLLLIIATTPASAQDVPRPVKVMSLEKGDGVMRRHFFGTVVARQTVDLAFQVSGQLNRFPVLEGEPVAKDALIAQLDLESFQRTLDQAKLQKEQADRSLNRLKQLSRATVSEASLEDAQTAADLAEIAVGDAQYALDRATLRAPFDGLVATRNVANFTTVQAGTAIVRLHDISEWRVEIEVPEVLFRRAGKDPDMKIFGTFTGSDRQIPLEVREFRAEASAVGQTFKITLAMLEEPGEGVLPGSSITVTADLKLSADRIEVPASAVVIDPDGTTALMVFEPGDADAGVARRREVTIEAGPDGEFLLADLLEPGIEVIVAGAGMLSDGQAVRRFKGFSE